MTLHLPTLDRAAAPARIEAVAPTILPRPARLSARRRLAVIVGASAVLWAGIALVAHAAIG